MESRILSGKEAEDILGDTRNALEQEGYNGGLLELHDILTRVFRTASCLRGLMAAPIAESVRWTLLPDSTNGPRPGKRYLASLHFDFLKRRLNDQPRFWRMASRRVVPGIGLDIR